MELFVAFLRWPFAVYVVWAVPVLYLVIGLVLRTRSTARRSAGAPAPASASAGIPRIPDGVHPLMVEAMMSNDVLGDHNKGVGTLEWLAACAMHAAATEGSVSLGTRAPAGMDDDALFEMVDVRRVAPVRDAVDAAVLGCYLPTGEEMSEMMAHLQEYEQRATTDAARRFLDKMRESVTVQRQDEATLGSVLKRLRADYSSMSGAFATMRGRLRELACQAGYMEDADPYHGERWRQWGGSLVLLWTAAGMLTAGGSGLPQGGDHRGVHRGVCADARDGAVRHSLDHAAECGGRGSGRRGQADLRCLGGRAVAAGGPRSAGCGVLLDRARSRWCPDDGLGTGDGCPWRCGAVAAGLCGLVRADFRTDR